MNFLKKAALTLVTAIAYVAGIYVVMQTDIGYDLVTFGSMLIVGILSIILFTRWIFMESDFYDDEEWDDAYEHCNCSKHHRVEAFDYDKENNETADNIDTEGVKFMDILNEFGTTTETSKEKAKG